MEGRCNKAESADSGSYNIFIKKMHIVFRNTLLHSYAKEL